jgi:hypothetical protein
MITELHATRYAGNVVDTESGSKITRISCFGLDATGVNFSMAAKKASVVSIPNLKDEKLPADSTTAWHSTTKNGWGSSKGSDSSKEAKRADHEAAS